MAFTKAGRDLKNKLKPPPPPQLTQVQLAGKLGVTQQAISAWMRGIAVPNGDERRALIEELTGVAASDWDVVVPDESTRDLGADESGEHSASDAAAKPARNTG